MQMSYSTSESVIAAIVRVKRLGGECATGLGWGLTCFKPPEYAVIGVLHRGEAAYFRG